MVSAGVFYPLVEYGVKTIAVVSVAYAGILAKRWRQRSMQNTATGWPSVEGTIQWAKAESVPKTHQYIVTLTYSYYVGEYRAGSFTQEFNRESDADEFARSMREHKLQIRYKESNPDISVIDQSTMEQVFALPLRR